MLFPDDLAGLRVVDDCSSSANVRNERPVRVHLVPERGLCALAFGCGDKFLAAWPVDEGVLLYTVADEATAWVIWAEPLREEGTR